MTGKGFFLLVLGGYSTLAGALLAAHPAAGKRWAAWLFKDKVSRPWALMPIAFGLAFLWASPASRYPSFIRILGLLTLVKGIYLLAAPRGSGLRVLRWWQELPPGPARIWGIASMAAGLAILASIGR